MQKRPIFIIGASGHGRVVADIATLIGYEEIHFLDDADNAVNVSGKVSDYVNYIDNADFFVAIGNNKIREKIFKQLQQNGANIVNLIHPGATVADNISIGKGTVIMAGAVVNVGTVLGNGVIVNTCSSVDHDCNIGDFVHVSVGAHLAGTVTVGGQTFVCAGATVINNVSICGASIIGAGAVVIENIEREGTYVGVPAEKV